MNVRSTLWVIFLLVLAGCQPATNDSPSAPVPAPASQLRFEFGLPAGADLPAAVKIPLAKVVFSFEAEDGEAVARTELAVTPTETGYATEALDLLPGTYRFTEFFALDSLDQAYGVVPTGDSYYGEVGGSHTVPFNLELAAGPRTETVGFRAVQVYTVPGDYGYDAFPTPRSVPAMDFAYRALDEAGNPIPSFLQEDSLRTTSSGKSSTFGWGNNPLGTPQVRTLYQGLKLADPNGYLATNQTVYVKLKIGSYGYEDSPLLYYFAGDLDARRQTDPVVDVVLRAEPSLVVLTPAGTNDAGLHVVKARLAASQFIERAWDRAGALAGDKYSYTIGFTLGSHQATVINGVAGWTSVSLVKPPTNPISSTFYTAPYNSAAAQAQNAYQTLEAELVVKDEAAWGVFNDTSVLKTMQVYVEVLMLQGDGSGVITGSEAFRGFETKVLKIGPQQIEIQD